MYLLGYDIGSSSIKAGLVDIDSGKTVGVVQSPETEMPMQADHPGWAEQHPEEWWKQVCTATQKLLESSGVKSQEIQGIGIAYQMHGLVLVDKNKEILRPSIIWCDSRAVGIGDQALEAIGAEACFSHCLNAPGNFTASKLKWVKDHEPAIYERIYKIMLPGDYIAMRLTGEIHTSIGGLSEGVFWDFKEHRISKTLLDYYGFEPSLIPEPIDTFSFQGKVTNEAAEATGLAPGIPVNYRAGDQPNNALSLNVLSPGEIAATGGTSGVVYGLVDRLLYDEESRVNGFAHVNHTAEDPRIGVLLCINGAGRQYRWTRQYIAKSGMSYSDMEKLATTIPVGSNALRVLPFGNGAERMLQNQNIGARIIDLQFNVHGDAHLFRATLEGIAFSFVYGIQVLKALGLTPSVIRVGNDNLFQSRIFSSTISSLMGSKIEVIETTGAVGAAKAAGVANKVYGSIHEAVQNTHIVDSFEPESEVEPYWQAFTQWKEDLLQISNHTQ